VGLADDVTIDKPLNGGRQRANHIQVHRIEAGLWERQHILKPMAKVADTAAEFAETAKVIKTAAIGAAGVGIIGVVWVAHKIGSSLYGWVEDAKEGSSTAGQYVVAGLPAGVRAGLNYLGIGDGEGWI